MGSAVAVGVRVATAVRVDVTDGVGDWTTGDAVGVGLAIGADAVGDAVGRNGTVHVGVGVFSRVAVGLAVAVKVGLPVGLMVAVGTG